MKAKMNPRGFGLQLLWKGITNSKSPTDMSVGRG